MFAQPNGKPIDPRRDHNEWKALLKEAEVREARLHDARHTAATTLLLLGVPERAVMDVMGWSNSAIVKRYAQGLGRWSGSLRPVPGAEHPGKGVSKVWGISGKIR